MIFSELYSAYYNAVAGILKEALEKPMTQKEIRKIVEETAFAESFLTIEQKLLNGNEEEGCWQLLDEEGYALVEEIPTMPLTKLQKRWLKAIASDKRIRLFLQEEKADVEQVANGEQDVDGQQGADGEPGSDGKQEADGELGSELDKLDFPDVEPLFRQDDYVIYDQYSDGDDYDDPDYRTHFRLVLDAIKNQYPIEVEMETSKNKRMHVYMLPEKIEYSEKDDKFRVIGRRGTKKAEIVNIARIKSVTRSDKQLDDADQMREIPKQSVTLAIYDARNALERVMLHFAHFEKRSEKLDDRRYKVTIYYDGQDETEMVIRILSFGPMVKVLEPDRMVYLIKARLRKQLSCVL